MKKEKILIAGTLVKDFTYIYKKHFQVEALWEKDIKKINFKKFDALVASGDFKIPNTFYKKLSNIKIISLFAVGYDNVNLEVCKKQNIVVANTPGLLTRDVANLGITLILSISRNIFNAQNFIINNYWKKGFLSLTDSICDKELGIIGLGKIGKDLAKKAESLSMKINYFGPNKKNVKYKYFNNLSKMAKYCDYLVIACTGGQKTKNLINSKILNSMKKNSFLINISRGTVIDENALIKTLKKRKIKGAALDVFLNEPYINPEFKKLKNIILHPHHASGTIETRTAMAELSCKNLINFFKKGKPLHRVI